VDGRVVITGFVEVSQAAVVLSMAVTSTDPATAAFCLVNPAPTVTVTGVSAEVAVIDRLPAVTSVFPSSNAWTFRFTVFTEDAPPMPAELP
jgi:hypothetical protein